MRATGQVQSLTGPLSEAERRLVAARAILGEWLGGSGGGWQDSGGIWPGMKMIEGRAGRPRTIRSSASAAAGCCPTIASTPTAKSARATRQQICDSFVLVHGGMAQNVGPILEMVTEKYLLRSRPSGRPGRRRCRSCARSRRPCARGDVAAIGRADHARTSAARSRRSSPGPSNHYTRDAHRARRGTTSATAFWGFLMLGGMSGGGMGFIFDPRRKTEAQDFLQELMSAHEAAACSTPCPSPWSRWSTISPINDRGTVADALRRRRGVHAAGLLRDAARRSGCARTSAS